MTPCKFDAGETLADGRTKWTCTNPGCGRVVALKRDSPPRASCPRSVLIVSTQVPSPAHGPGTELATIIHQLGGREQPGCGCASLVARMNAWMVEGCREHRAEIIAALTDAAGKWGLTDWIAGGWRAVASGLAWRLSPSDPIGSLVDLAIERATARQAPQ